MEQSTTCLSCGSQAFIAMLLFDLSKLAIPDLMSQKAPRVKLITRLSLKLIISMPTIAVPCVGLGWWKKSTNQLCGTASSASSTCEYD